MTPPATVVRGVILAYRVYDAGDTIALDTAERVLPAARRLAFGGPLVEASAWLMKHPPASLTDDVAKVKVGEWVSRPAHGRRASLR